MKVLNEMVVFFLKFYQKLISPLLGNRCRFYPSCSSYAVESFKEFHFFKAVLKVVYRLLRCGPWSKGGYDPVPSNYLKNNYKGD